MRGALAKAAWREVGRSSPSLPGFSGNQRQRSKGFLLPWGPSSGNYSLTWKTEMCQREGVMVEGPGECLASQGSPLAPTACLSPGCRHLWSLPLPLSASQDAAFSFPHTLLLQPGCNTPPLLPPFAFLCTSTLHANPSIFLVFSYSTSLAFYLTKLLLGLTQGSVAPSARTWTMPREGGGHTTVSSQCVSWQHPFSSRSLAFLWCQHWLSALSSWSGS